jgi:ribosomal protein L40E
MARKTVGYVRLEWTCPNCGTKNPGPRQQCLNCGGSQPEDLKFEPAAGQELVTDEEELARAKAGPDVHCFYCGTRNPAGTTTCKHCGGDLSQGTARTKGQVVGAFQAQAAEEIKCPNCEQLNPAAAPTCRHCGASLLQENALPPAPTPGVKPQQTPGRQSRRLVAILGVALVSVFGLCLTLAILARQTNDLIGQVQNVSWQRSISVEVFRPATYEGWRAQIPGDAIVGYCQAKFHHSQDEPTRNSEEVCGTPYTLDTGSGHGQVVQDCQYRVFEDWCEYTVDEWQQVDLITRSGNDYSPQWPLTSLSFDQRDGERQEVYQVEFTTESGTYEYRPRSETEFAGFSRGSRWLLKVNTFGQVVEVKPTS